MGSASLRGLLLLLLLLAYLDSGSFDLWATDEMPSRSFALSMLLIS
jgi:hypothetical protein